MKCFNSLSAFAIEKEDASVALCIGNFDGVHRGHRALFDLAGRIAGEQNGICGALTFSPHPEVFFRGNAAACLIYSQETKLNLFGALGLDFAVVQPFFAEFAEISAEEFVPALKRAIPSLSGVFVGENFRFGARCRGNVESLRESAAALGIDVYALAPVLFENEKISSTRIREALKQGKTREANAMLSAPYFSEGIIIPGRQLGRTIGFPTLNLPWEPELLPRFGVYAVSVEFGGKTFPGIANYGVRPTVERSSSPAPLLETFLTEIPSGAEVPSYGDRIVVRWLDFLRPEARFESVDALREQLLADRCRAEAFFGKGV